MNKKVLIISLVICSLFLAACQHDLPLNETAEIDEQGVIKGQFGEQLEKKPIRMFNVDGDLYYDSGLVSENTPRCGTMDGELTNTVSENEIPLKSGEANFDIDGYQHATSITKEVNIDGEWLIFKKYNTYEKNLEDLKYCYYIKGHLNNAAVDSEFVVLTDNINVTFNDVISPMLSFVKENDNNDYRISHNMIVSGDKWGITLYTDNVTPKGLTLKIEQFGGNPSGTLEYGTPYILETTVDDEWQEVKTTTGEPLVWTLPAYGIKMNDITEININWEYGYGELKPGFYRLRKEITDFRESGDYDKETYEVYFTIE